MGFNGNSRQWRSRVNDLASPPAIEFFRALSYFYGRKDEYADGLYTSFQPWAALWRAYTARRKNSLSWHKSGELKWAFDCIQGIFLSVTKHCNVTFG